MWMMPLLLHVNQKSDYDDDDRLLHVLLHHLLSGLTLVLQSDAFNLSNSEEDRPECWALFSLICRCISRLWHEI